MNIAKTAVSGMVLSAALSLSAVQPAGAEPAAEPCVSGAEVRAQVKELVAGLTDDVKSRHARDVVKTALVESMRSYRGERANSAAERRALGEAISTLARRQSETENRVEGRALSAAILALTEQREARARFSAAEREELRTSLDAMQEAVTARTSDAAEGQEVADAFQALHTQFNCMPA